jgi:hypothetical protein
MPGNGFVLFDAARAENNLYKALELSLVHRSFYKGRSEEELAAVAPYLFEISGNSRLANWYIQEGWGNSWGVFVNTSKTHEEIFLHFRKFLMVKTEQGKELYFRFYDPRVLKVFLPSCDKGQIMEFFGPVSYFIVEGDTGEEAVQFWQENGFLRQRKSDVRQLFVEYL